MASHERPPGEPGKEIQPAFLRAVRFDGETTAKATYFQMQEAVFANDWDLSVYRFLLSAISHVAILGAAQPPEVQATVEGILSPGEPANLPPHIVSTLLQRREQAKRVGPWV